MHKFYFYQHDIRNALCVLSDDAKWNKPSPIIQQTWCETVFKTLDSKTPSAKIRIHMKQTSSNLSKNFKIILCLFVTLHVGWSTNHFPAVPLSSSFFLDFLSLFISYLVYCSEMRRGQEVATSLSSLYPSHRPKHLNWRLSLAGGGGGEGGGDT